MAGRLARLKERPWVAHLLRAGARYTSRLGSQFAAAITYFSVLAVVPTLMFIFAVAGFVLTVARPELLLPLATAAADAVGAADRVTRDKILATITNVLSHYTSIGIVGLLSAVYSGSGWMGNLKNAVRAQARDELDLQPAPANFLAKTAANLATLIGLVVLIAVTFGLASVSTSLTGTQSAPKMLMASPARDPNTTMATATSRPQVSQCCRLGSRPEMIGASKIPAAKKDAAVHSSESCTCQVRARLNGSSWARSKPKKLARSAR